MKFKIMILGSILLSAFSNANANADEIEIEKHDTGIFMSEEIDPGMVHVVDTVSQLCYAKPAHYRDTVGIILIPCENLARRPEWRKYITWINSASNK